MIELLNRLSKNRKRISKKPSIKSLKFNINQDAKDERDYELAKLTTIVGETDLPNYIDLRNYCTPIKNQLTLSCCGGYGGGSAWEIMKNISQNQMGTTSGWDISELYIYYNTRALMGTINQDSGVTLRELCKAIVEQGCSLEYLCPYDISKFTQKPSWINYWLKNITGVDSYYRCNTIHELHIALSKKLPVVIGMVVHEGFYKNKKGTVYSEVTGNKLGGHCMTVVAIDNNKRKILLRNSWGDSWCDNGYIWVSYEVFNQTTFDMWVLVKNNYDKTSLKADKIIYSDE